MQFLILTSMEILFHRKIKGVMEEVYLAVMFQKSSMILQNWLN